MASNEILDREQHCSNGVLLSLIRSMSDGQLLNQIYETHLPPIQNFDPTSLFTHIKEVLCLATHLVDNALLGTQDLDLEGEGEEFWDMEEYMDKHLLRTLEQISSELAAKSPYMASELRQKSMSILKNVSSYSWAAKAVLTLAAFALDYGDFWALAQLNSLEQLAKAVGIEKVLVHDPPLKRPDIQKWENEIGEVSNLIKDTLEVVGLVVELERLSKLAYTYGNILALTTAKDCIPLPAYWAIISVVACTTQMFYLSSDNKDKELELSPLTQEMNLTLNLVKKNIKYCHQQIEEVKKYHKEEEVPEIPKKILEGFKAMIFAGENSQPVLTDGSTNKTLSLDVLKDKNILLFISDIDISVEEISILKPIFDGTRTDDRYKIVWIPMVEQWNDETKTKFEMLQSSMPWYIMQHFSQLVDIGHSFSTEEWNFKNKPIVVNINPQGEVEHPNAIRMIRLWGTNSFPFNIKAEKALIPPAPRWKPVFHRIRVLITRQTGPWSANLEEEEYRFFYGFTNIKWKQQFIRNMTIIFHDSTIKNSQTRIKWYWIGEGNKKEDVQKLVSGKHDPKKFLLPFKTDNGWVELRKGPDTILGDKGTTILKVLEKFDDWKGFVGQFGFDHCFRDCYKKVQKALPPN